jgi:hypothetical protein
MSSETSSDIKSIKYLDKHGNQLDTKTEMKRQTTDTDYHFGMIANQERIFSPKSESSSDLNNVVDSSDTKKSSSSSSSSSRSKHSRKSSSSSSKPRIENVNLNSTVFKQNIPDSKSTFIPNVEPTVIPTTQLSPQEIRMKKIELLRRLSEIKAKGYSLTKEYDFNSSIDEMEYEYALLKSFADKRNGVKIYKNILLNGISLIEFLNDKYDPFDFQLKGWSEHMSVEVDSYEDIFEELYEKYKGSGKSTPPEIRLILLILASGAAFHFSRTQLGGMPGVGSAATGMLNKMMANPKKDSQFMSPQEINLEKQKQMLREKEKEIKQKKNQQQMNQFNNKPQTNQFNNIPVNQFNNTSVNQFNTTPMQQFTQNTSLTRDIPDIRAPENVQEILSRIKHIQQNNNSLNNTTETQEESTINDRLVSDSTLSENKKRGRKPKKSLISINTD